MRPGSAYITVPDHHLEQVGDHSEPEEIIDVSMSSTKDDKPPRHNDDQDTQIIGGKEGYGKPLS